MSANSTAGLPPASNASYPSGLQCIESADGRNVLTSISVTYTLIILPLSVLVLHVGFQRWRWRRSVSLATVVSHSDFFTYNMVVTEVIGAFGYSVYYCSSYANLQDVMSLSVGIMYFTWPGQTLFPILTCVDCYLAVVHPITYRAQRRAGGVRIRNLSTGCIWLICVVWMVVVMKLNITSAYKHGIIAFVLTFSLVVMVFCSLSVLRVLIRPGPGGVGGARRQADQSKQRAVRVMLIIMGMLWLKLGGNAILALMRFTSLKLVKCVVEAFSFVFFLPNSVVLPLMFLHRAGKLPKC